MKNAVNSSGESSDKLFNFRPMLFAAFFLVLGVVFSYYRILYAISYAWLLTLLPVFLFPLLFSSDFCNFLFRVSAVLLLALSFGVGVIVFRGQTARYESAPKYVGEMTVVGDIENRKTSSYGTQLTLKNLIFEQEVVEEVDGRLSLYISDLKAKELAVGDRVLLKGRVETNVALGGEYGYRESDISKKVYYTMDVTGYAKVGKSQDGFLLVRGRLEEVLYAGMDETPAALTLALLTGDIGGVDKDLMDNMRYGGISHIFAVSGLNVGALFACCMLLFSKTPLRRAPKPLRFALLCGLLFFYSGVCGFSASVVRAAITCATLYFTRLFGVGNDPLNALGFAAIVILLVSPAELMNVGFQLSFLACVGLFTLMKPTGYVFDELQKAYRKCFPRRYSEEEKEVIESGDTLPRRMREDVWLGVKTLLSASIAAQLATLPLLLIHFDRISGWALLLNFFFVPVTDALFTALLSTSAIACLLPTAFSGGLLFLFSIAWSGAILIFQAVDFSSFAITGVQLSFGACVFYYGALSFCTDKLNISSKLKKGLFFFCSGAFLLLSYLYNL